jgi:hypothetical protein
MGKHREPAKKHVKEMHWFPKQTYRGLKYRHKEVKDTLSLPSSPSKSAKASNASTPSQSRVLPHHHDLSDIPALSYSIDHSEKNLLRSWLPFRDAYLHSLLDAEAPRGERICSMCHVGDGSWRCRDCAFRPLFCVGCCRRSHSHLPYHRVEAWTGSHFSPGWLRDVGIAIYLGHDGKKCPTAENVVCMLSVSFS